MAVPRRALAEQPRGMIRSAKNMTGFSLMARDGRIGRVKDFYFDDISWTVRYIVADTGGWISGRKVLISPSAVLQPDWRRETLRVDLSREQVEKSPGIETDEPVSRRHQMELYRYYGWGTYWTGAVAPPYPALVPSPMPVSEEEGDPHLRSSREVMGYHIQASDGRIGHVDDFLADDQAWIIRYMAVDTRYWLPGKKVLVAVSWVNSIDWGAGSVSVDLAKDAIRNSPEYSAAEVTPEYEEALFAYYNRPGYWV